MNISYLTQVAKDSKALSGAGPNNRFFSHTFHDMNGFSFTRNRTIASIWQAFLANAIICACIYMFFDNIAGRNIK